MGSPPAAARVVLRALVLAGVVASAAAWLAPAAPIAGPAALRAGGSVGRAASALLGRRPPAGLAAGRGFGGLLPDPHQGRGARGGGACQLLQLKAAMGGGPGGASAERQDDDDDRLLDDGYEEDEAEYDYDDEDIDEEELEKTLFATKLDDEVDPRAIFVPAEDNEVEDSWFASMGLLPGLCKALAGMGIYTPTDIQKQSLPTAIAGESVLLCAETGSGKTLSFLLPLAQRVKRDEGALGINTRPYRPRAMVLAPTRELGQQILQVAKDLSVFEKFSSTGLFGGTSMAKQAKRLGQGVDVVVGTPGRMVELVDAGHLRLGDVRFIVADEADTMASQGFGEDLKKLFTGVVGASKAARESYQKAEAARAKLNAMAQDADSAQEAAAVQAEMKRMRGPFSANDKGNVQCILAAATVPPSVKEIMTDTFPKHREVKTLKAHLVPDRIAQEFLRVTGNDRAQTLIDVIDRGQRMNKAAWARARELDGAVRDATIVFCNTKDSAVFAAKLLREEGLAVAEGHGWLPQSDRAVQLEKFMKGEIKILVSTDIMARGIDTINVAHVVNFDFPRNPVDYLHRIGRTARSGGTGRVTNLVAKKDYTLAMAIERASKLGKPIEALSSRRTDYVQGMPGMLKSDKPPSRSKPPPPRPRAKAYAKPARSAKPKPKDTTMKKMTARQPKKKRGK